jgi:phosphoribosylformylglycinamidine synthase
MPICTRPCARWASSCAPALGITIPVGKDSLSMRTAWTRCGGSTGARAGVADRLGLRAGARRAPHADTATRPSRPSRLLLIDLGAGKEPPGRIVLGAGVRARGGEPADLDDPALLRLLSRRCANSRIRGLLLAYHDRSDGGLLITPAGDGVRRPLRPRCRSGASGDPGRRLLRGGARRGAADCEPRLDEALAVLARHGSGAHGATSARPRGERAALRGAPVSRCTSLARDLHRRWSEVSFRMQALRDNPECAREEYAAAR